MGDNRFLKEETTFGSSEYGREHASGGFTDGVHPFPNRCAALFRLGVRGRAFSRTKTKMSHVPPRSADGVE